jgi:hypothetical protein
MMNSQPEFRLTVNQGELHVTCWEHPPYLLKTLLVQNELSAGSPTRRDPSHSQLRGQWKALRGDIDRRASGMALQILVLCRVSCSSSVCGFTVSQPVH